MLNEWLPNRPAEFDPNYLDILRKSNVNKDMLIKHYLKHGGQQWAESIDSDLALATIEYCMDSKIEGAILVFLPGYDDISNLKEKVQEVHSRYYKPVVYTLHSQMNSQDQQQVFEEPKRGYRKVILSTNIAEASLTIDDVVFVIDCGKVKEKSYEHNSRISQLKVSWIAKSNAEQRAGR
jgi:HrpA-like RNA helicase